MVVMPVSDHERCVCGVVECPQAEHHARSLRWRPSGPPRATIAGLDDNAAEVALARRSAERMAQNPPAS